MPVARPGWIITVLQLPIGSKCAFQLSAVKQVHILSCPHHLEAIVERQKRLQEILLVPEELLLEPVLNVDLRKKDVVQVNDDAFAESRQDLQALEPNIAAGSQHVA